MNKNNLKLVNRDEFLTELSKHSELWDYFKDNIDQEKAVSNEGDMDNEFAIYRGDITDNISLNMEAFNMLFIGNIESTLIDSDTDDLGWDEGGSLFITGNVECDYFNGHYGKTTIIGGDLTVKKVLNCGFQDSTSFVLVNLQAKFNYIGDTPFTSLIKTNIENEFYYGDDATELRKSIGLSLDNKIDEIELQERFRELVRK